MTGPRARGPAVWLAGVALAAGAAAPGTAVPAEAERPGPGAAPAPASPVPPSTDAARRLRIEITVDRIDYADLVPAPPPVGPAGSTPAGPALSDASESGEPARPPPVESPAAGRVFSPAPLPLGWLRGLDAVVDLRAAEVTGRAIALTDVAARLDMDGRTVNVEPLGATVGSAPVRGRARLELDGDGTAVELDLTAPRIDVGSLVRAATDSDRVEGEAEAAIRVSGRGASVAAIMASLDGEVRALMSGGRAKTQTIDRWVSGIRSVMKIPGRDTEWTPLNCAAVAFDIAGGVATSRVLLVDGERVTVAGSGTIDLGRETLDLKLVPRPKSVTLNVSVPVNVGGTLAAPTFSPDKLAAARRLGGLLGAAVFPPAALAAFAALGTRDDHPCLTIASREGGTATPDGGSEPASRSGSDGAPQGAVERAQDGAKGALEGIRKGLGGLIGR